MPPTKSGCMLFLTAVLDEIERLRGVLCLEHSSECAILRAGAACTCGAVARTVAMLSETHLLRAQLVQAHGLAECAQREIARMDLQVLELMMAQRTAVFQAGAMGATDPVTTPKARGSSPNMRAVVPTNVEEAPSDADGFKVPRAASAAPR